MKTNAMVMEINPQYLIVVTREGVFRKIPKTGQTPRLGQIIEINTQTRSKWHYYLGAAALLLVMIASTLITQHYGAQPIAALTIDINPSLKLYVNNELDVVKTAALNEDARKLLKKSSVKGKNVYEAVQNITAEATKAGYLGQEKDNLILLSVVDLDSAKPTGLLVEAQQTIARVLSEKHLSGTVQVFNPSKSKADQAEEKGLSVNKLIFQEKARSKGLSVSDNDLKNMSVAKILKKEKQSIPEFFAPEKKNNGKNNPGETKDKKAEKKESGRDKKSPPDNKEKRNRSEQDEMNTSPEAPSTTQDKQYRAENNYPAPAKKK